MHYQFIQWMFRTSVRKHYSFRDNLLALDKTVLSAFCSVNSLLTSFAHEDPYFRDNVCQSRFAKLELFIVRFFSNAVIWLVLCCLLTIPFRLRFPLHFVLPLRHFGDLRTQSNHSKSPHSVYLPLFSNIFVCGHFRKIYAQVTLW